MTVQKTRDAQFDNAKGFLIVCVVMGHLCEWYISESRPMAGWLFLLIYLFHMPAFLFLSGVFSGRTIRQRRYAAIGSYYLLYLFIKTLLYVVRLLLFHKGSFQLLTESGISWYAFALGTCCLVTIVTARLPAGTVLMGSILLACLFGYLDVPQDFLVAARTVNYYPFFFAGYCLSDRERLARFTGFLNRPYIKWTAAALLLLYALAMLRFGDSVYWLRPLLTGRNPYSKLSQLAWYGGILRLLYYPAVGTLIAAVVAAAPCRALPPLTVFGRRSLSIYAFHFCVLYLIWDVLGFRGVIAGVQGPLFFAILLAAALAACGASLLLPMERLMQLCRPRKP